MPKVSVIIPTYNYGKYIDKAIDSVLAQTYQNFEIIVVDDGSTDNTEEIVLGRYKDNVRYFYQENRGAPAARNSGTKRVRGRYLVFLDADDFLHHEYLQKMVAGLNSSKEAGWIYCRWQYVDTKGNIQESAFSNTPFAYRKKLRGNIFMEMLSGSLICCCAVLIKSECVEEVGGFDERLTAFQDYDLWLRIARRYEVEYIDDVLAFVTLHEGSISTKGKPYPSRSIINSKIEENYSDYIVRLGVKWRKIKAAEYYYLGNKMLKNGGIDDAMKFFKYSIRQYPLQKRIYFEILLGFLKKYKIL